MIESLDRGSGTPQESEVLIEEQIRTLQDLLLPRLLDIERPTFSIREAVTHGDIEVFLNGRIYPISSKHFGKVEDAGPAMKRSFAGEILTTLRSKKYEYTAENFTYTLRDVLQEIQFVLSAILERALPEKEIQTLGEKLDGQLAEAFGLEALPRELAAPHHAALIRLLEEALVGLVQATRTKRKAR